MADAVLLVLSHVDYVRGEENGYLTVNRCASVEEAQKETVDGIRSMLADYIGTGLAPELWSEPVDREKVSRLFHNYAEREQAMTAQIGETLLMFLRTDLAAQYVVAQGLYLWRCWQVLIIEPSDPTYAEYQELIEEG